MALEYLDKEINAMAWLASIGAALASVAVSQPLFVLEKKEARLGALLTNPDSALLAVGCAILLSSAGCFLGQRIQMTTRYGQACGLLLTHNDPTDLLSFATLWPSWQPYLWGMNLFVIGITQTLLGLVLLNWSLAQPTHFFLHQSAWPLAVLAPLVVLLSYRLAKRWNR